MSQLVATGEATSGLLGIETNIFLFRVPGASSTAAAITAINAASISLANAALFRVYQGPTITNNGTVLTTLDRNVGLASTGNAIFTINPTASARGSLMGHFTVGQYSNSLFLIDGIVSVQPGNSILITVASTLLNQVVAVDMIWEE